MAHLQQLLDQACQPEHPSDIRRLARNHALDLADVRSTHPDAATCGNQIPTSVPLLDATDYAVGPVPDNLDKQIIYYDRLERVLTRLLDPQRNAPSCGVTSGLQGTIRLSEAHGRAAPLRADRQAPWSRVDSVPGLAGFAVAGLCQEQPILVRLISDLCGSMPRRSARWHSPGLACPWRTGSRREYSGRWVQQLRAGRFGQVLWIEKNTLSSGCIRRRQQIWLPGFASGCLDNWTRRWTITKAGVNS